MTSSELLDSLFKAGESHEFVSFEGSVDERTVNAAVIHEYLLKSSSPLRMKGAIIQGDLHLENAVQRGDVALPAIFLHNCELHGALLFAGAKLRHLSLRGCRFRQLDVVAASILGDLDCSNAAPLVVEWTTDLGTDEADGSPRDGQNPATSNENLVLTPVEEAAYILGRGVRIAGNVFLSGANLRALEKRATVSDTEDKRWAVQLNGSRIEGTIYLNNCTAFGGIHLGSSRVDGDVWCHDLSCTATEADALKLQTARIAGVLRFERSTMRGRLSLLSATVDHLAFFKSSFHPDSEGSCITAEGIEVTGNVLFMSGCETFGGTITFDQARIGGSLHCECCLFEGLKANSRERKVAYGAICFSADNATIRGDLQFKGNDERELVVNGAVSFRGIEVEGAVSIESARVTCTSGDLPPCAIYLHDAYIGGGVNLGPKLHLRGSIMLDLTEIGGDFRIDDSTITTLVRTGQTSTQDFEGERKWFEFVFSARSLRVKGSVIFMGTLEKQVSKQGSSCKFIGVLNFAGSEIGHDILFRGADFDNSQKFEPRAVDVTGCRIAGSVSVENCHLRGGLRLMFSRLSGSLNVVESKFFPARGAVIPGFALDLDSARVDGPVNLKKSDFNGIVLLDFARLDGPLHISQSNFAEGSSKTRDNLSRVAAIRAHSADIRGELVIGPDGLSSKHEADAKRMQIAGLLDLSRTQVSSRFRLAECTLSPREDSPIALQAEQLSVTGSIEMEDVEFLGSVEAKHMTVRTNLSWKDVFFGVLDRSPKAEYKFDLQYVRIEGALIAKGLKHCGPLTIDLSSGSAGSLNDDVGSGWGRVQEEVPELKVNLQGFVYQSTCDRYPRRGNKFLSWRDWPETFDFRLHWLSQSDDDRRRALAHYPQPYRRYSAVLRSHGFDALSREVAAQDGWKEFHSEWKRANLFRVLWLCFVWPFGYFFGFGYKPNRAFWTMVVLLLIGTWFAATAANRGMLVLSSPAQAAKSTVSLGAGASAAVKGQLSSRTYAPPPLPEAPPAERLAVPQVPAAKKNAIAQTLVTQEPVSCDFMSPWRSHSPGHALFSDFFYAVNLALPIVQLHEKSECEIASPASASDDQHSDELSNWHYLENGYSIIAKLCTTLAIITFSGVLRRSE